MKNTERHLLHNAFTLPKVAVTKTPSLDVVIASQCSKSTKANDKSLARIQALTLDAVGPLTELLKLLNDDKKEITSEQVGYAVESAITLLGNASTQMSALRHQRVLEEYNKDLLSFAQESEAEFVKAAPQLLGTKFPGEAAEHISQLEALRKAKSTNSSSGSFFGRAQLKAQASRSPMAQDSAQLPTHGQQPGHRATRRGRRAPNDN